MVDFQPETNKSLAYKTPQITKTLNDQQAQNLVEQQAQQITTMLKSNPDRKIAYSRPQPVALMTDDNKFTPDQVAAIFTAGNSFPVLNSAAGADGDYYIFFKITNEELNPKLAEKAKLL